MENSIPAPLCVKAGNRKSDVSKSACLCFIYIKQVLLLPFTAGHGVEVSAAIKTARFLFR